MSKRPYFLALVLASTFLAGMALSGPALAQELPDLVVREDVLSQQWVVREEKLSAGVCSVVEGGVQAGWRKLLRFTVSTANIGNGDVSIGDPREHFAANDGLFEFATCHNHFHFRNYALYELIDPATGRAWRAAKRGFCMEDSHPNPPPLGGEPPRNPTYVECGTVTESGNQGISHGWSDTYFFLLGGQYFVLDGGDGQDPVPPGEYIIRITVNPSYRPRGKEPCRALNAQTGLCHQLAESSYENNVAQVAVTIPEHPGQVGTGPLTGAEHLETEPID